MRRIVMSLLFALLIGAPAARAEVVDLALVLAVDVSGSINEEEYRLQREGYAAAFTDPRVLNAIRSGPRKKIAVTFVEWSGLTSQRVTVDWQVIGDEESAELFAAAILAAKRPFGDRTSISAGIDFALRQFDQSGVTSERRTIDISGDGSNNAGRPVQQARDEAVRAGITINGLAIVNGRDDSDDARRPAAGRPPASPAQASRIGEYYRRVVIGGPGAFALTVEGFESFGFAIANKLVREIAWTPAPATRPVQLADAS